MRQQTIVQSCKFGDLFFRPEALIFPKPQSLAKGPVFAKIQNCRKPSTIRNIGSC